MAIVTVDNGVLVLTITAPMDINMQSAFDTYNTFMKQFNSGSGCTKISWLQDALVLANYRLKIFYPAGLTWNQLVITTPPSTFSVGNGIFTISEQPTRTEIRTKCEFMTTTYGCTSIVMQ